MDGAGTTRAGHVALLGRPNAGKSTLLNALTGEKLSIVTPRAQTTRERVLGILTRPEAQVIFVDTPGLLEPSYMLQRAMLETALSALHDADVVLLLLDGTRSDEPVPPAVVEHLLSRRQALLVAVNKVDEATAERVSALMSWSRHTLEVEALSISAATGAGLGDLLERLVARLPESPFLYPEDDLAVQPVRFFIEELVRETIFEEYEEEIPYSSVVRIDEYREAADPVYIRATVFVERESQKAILIGKGGAGIKRLGARSREKAESFLGQKVYLDLWVKHMPGWRRKAGSLRYLGYRVPEAERGRGEGG
jgi:GTPase